MSDDLIFQFERKIQSEWKISAFQRTKWRGTFLHMNLRIEVKYPK